MSDAPHILVVDDAPIIRSLMKVVLGKSGFGVSEAGCGEEAIASSRVRAPDLILMDLEMPGIPGLEAIAQFRADAELSKIPIIACSGNTDPKTMQAAQAAGADGYLIKDAHLKDRLIDTIRRYLRSRSVALLHS